MTTTLVFRFPWGRYHATPWGRHVNEGAVELPPSPWRLLRALYAVWCTRVPDLDEQTVHSLLAALARPPTVYVPPHTISHTRHYYPDTKHTRGAYSVDRTLDAFAVFDTDAKLAVQWQGVTLTAGQRDALEKLATAMPYFGRADSICDVWVADDWMPDRHDVWESLDVAEHIRDDVETATVLAPEASLNLDSLTARPVNVRKGKLLFPVGTRLVGYQRVETAPSRRRQARSMIPERAKAVRFEIAQNVLPRELDALVYTDLLRAAALRKLGDIRDEPEHTLLGGKTALGKKSTNNHEHAHYLPLFDQHRLTGLVVWVPGSEYLDGDELQALLKVRRLATRINDKWRLNIRVAGIGDIADVAPKLCGTSEVWESVTPFAPSMSHFKKSWDIDRIMRMGVERELRYRGHEDATVDVKVLDSARGFRRYRITRPNSGGNKPGAMLRLTFDQPLSGPLAFGHLSHFGLGLFVPR